LKHPKWIKDYLLKKFASEIVEGAQVVDIGAGSGQYRKYLTHCEYISLDLKDACDIRGDAHRLPFTNDVADVVLCMEVLEHCVDPFTVMEELGRILKPSGVLLLSVPFLYPEHDTPKDYWRFTWSSIPIILKNDFLVVAKYKTGFGSLYVGWFVVARKI